MDIAYERSRMRHYRRRMYAYWLLSIVRPVSLAALCVLLTAAMVCITLFFVH